MVQIGGNLKFPGWSGIIESLQNSITLKASPSGNVIISQNNNLLPEIDLIQDLGRADLRWENIWSASGTFDVRPTVNGINVALATELAGQTVLNGISGAITLDSPDESINVNVNGQSIEVTTPTSGAPSGASYLLQEYNDNDHLTQARILSATSGVRLDDQGARSGSGVVITLDFDDEPTVGQAFVWGGQKGEWTTIAGASQLNKTTRIFTSSSGLEFVVEHALNTEDWTWSMWRNDGTPIEILLPDNVYPSGVDHAVIAFTSSDSDPSGYDGKIIFTG